MKPDLRGMTREELTGVVAALGEPSYRADQILQWLFKKGVASVEEMSNLSKAVRARLATNHSLTALELVRKQGSADATVKFLWRLADGQLIESVLIPASPALYGEPSDRRTICVSTQVGCAYGCKFCASGLRGFKRNLTAGEIVDQVLAVERHSAALELASLRPPTDRPASASRPRLIQNLVFMGMGEPLANYDNLLRALRIITAPWGVGIGARKITISTSGLVPQIQQLAREPHQVRLAVSLHGATDEVRDRIMPVNRRWPLRELLAACEAYVKEKQRRISFEYILLAGVNDTLDQAERLAAISKRLRAKVNLIPYNPVPGLPWQRPAPEQCNAFHKALRRRGVAATLRLEKGADIDAACGQLRLRTESEGTPPVTFPSPPPSEPTEGWHKAGPNHRRAR